MISCKRGRFLFYSFFFFQEHRKQFQKSILLASFSWDGSMSDFSSSVPGRTASPSPTDLKKFIDFELEKFVISACENPSAISAKVFSLVTNVTSVVQQARWPFVILPWELFQRFRIFIERIQKASSKAVCERKWEILFKICVKILDPIFPVAFTNKSYIYIICH